MLEKRNYIEPNILEIAIMEMGRLKKNQSFSLDEVVKWIYPEHWFFFLPDAKAAMMGLFRSGKIIVLENDRPVVPDLMSTVSYRIKPVFKTS